MWDSLTYKRQISQLIISRMIKTAGDPIWSPEELPARQVLLNSTEHSEH